MAYNRAFAGLSHGQDPRHWLLGCNCDGEQSRLPELRELVGAGKSTKKYISQCKQWSTAWRETRQGQGPESEGMCEGPVLMRDQGWLWAEISWSPGLRGEQHKRGEDPLPDHTSQNLSSETPHAPHQDQRIGQKGISHSLPLSLNPENYLVVWPWVNLPLTELQFPHL